MLVHESPTAAFQRYAEPVAPEPPLAQLHAQVPANLPANERFFLLTKLAVERELRRVQRNGSDATVQAVTAVTADYLAAVQAQMLQGAPFVMPNATNLKNQRRIATLQATVRSLQQEKKEWKEIRKQLDAQEKATGKMQPEVAAAPEADAAILQELPKTIAATSEKMMLQVDVLQRAVAKAESMAAEFSERHGAAVSSVHEYTFAGIDGMTAAAPDMGSVPDSRALIKGLGSFAAMRQGGKENA